ncbi:uncharacterized protein LOC125194111 isoform X2 [Salvia hispanica]|uniref:uncharacterized protein LOC125194111 isoform X2 n=1 Tax=Salvia hispanica TaxID=49212 RepID=UPI0020091273|nr:uncharacterized protein LOC125194111 isoform X2 [Salvia hispanica]XP_047948112.1 uncharacterized protein LOC125194111 isoform X2 [Salvia hispanica]
MNTILGPYRKGDNRGFYSAGPKPPSPIMLSSEKLSVAAAIVAKLNREGRDVDVNPVPHAAPVKSPGEGSSELVHEVKYLSSPAGLCTMNIPGNLVSLGSCKIGFDAATLDEFVDQTPVCNPNNDVRFPLVPNPHEPVLGRAGGEEAELEIVVL